MPDLPAWPAAGGGLVELYDQTAGGGLAEFDTGVLDLTSYRQLELEMRGRTNSADIYDFPLLRLNGDNDASHYSHAAQGSNPMSTSAPGGFFAARWDSKSWFGGASGGAIPAGILTGYLTGANAQAGYTGGWRGILFEPGEPHLPHSLELYTRYIEARTQAHAAVDNGPEIITAAGFWTPDAAAAINRLQLTPGLGTLFNAGSRFTIRGVPR